MRKRKPVYLDPSQTAGQLQADPRFRPQYVREEREGRDTLTYYACSATGWKGVFTTRGPAYSRPGGQR